MTAELVFSLRAALVAASVILAACGESSRRSSDTTASAPVKPPLPQDFTSGRAVYGMHNVPGGANVTLGPETEIQVQPPASGSNYAVTAKGQMRLLASGDSSAVYTIQAGPVEIAVNKGDVSVRAYPTDSTVQVVVAEGSATLSLDGKTETLDSGTVATVTSDKRLNVNKKTDLAPYLVWTDGTLQYANVPFRKIIPDLERVFDITIVVDDSRLYSERVTGKFYSGSFIDMLGDLMPSIDGKFTIKDRTVHLAHDEAPGRPQPPPPHSHNH